MREKAPMATGVSDDSHAPAALESEWRQEQHVFGFVSRRQFQMEL
jgi:hypothetical protein